MAQIASTPTCKPAFAVDSLFELGAGNVYRDARLELRGTVNIWGSAARMGAVVLLRIAGRDCSRDLGPQLEEAARAREDRGVAVSVGAEGEILSLRTARDLAEYQQIHGELLRSRSGVDTSRFRAPGGDGARAWLRGMVWRLLWRVLRYQHDWVTFRQNTVNMQLLCRSEVEREIRAGQIAELERRVRDLETSRSTDDPSAREPTP